jgi:acyl-CoA synthetase (AMP-forming)/AMP-acid ligase II
MTESRLDSLLAIAEEAAASETRDEIAIASPEGEATWSELRSWAEAAASRLSGLRGARVGLVVRPSPASVAALAALERLSSDVFLLNPGLDDAEREETGRRFRLSALVESRRDDGGITLGVRALEGGEPGGGAPTVTILTSGTSGAPKAARHTWESLLRPVRRGSSAAKSRWLVTYPLHLYAGLQVLCQCLADGGCLVIAPRGATSDELACLLVDRRIEFASGTPSFWRRLALFADPARLEHSSLRQITLGGETVDQGVLDLLARRFPNARRVHIYATSEHGRCFSVTDGQAGFPRRFLDGPSPDGVRMKVEGGQLLIQSANAMREYDRYGPGDPTGGEWRPTGDLVRIEGDRVFFEGRISDILNVGGQKVHPLEVERQVRSVPGVADVRVFGRRSSIAGQLVACEIVVEDGFDPEAVRQAVVRHCAERLQDAQRPRFIEIVPQLALSDANKTVRRTS